MKRDMRKYILRKLVELIFTLLFVTLLSFLLMRLSSVDPATAYAKRMIGNPTAEQIEKIRIQLGFDKPLLVQYGRWVWDLLHFDLGVSLANGHDVWTDIATAFPKTLGIVALASIFYFPGNFRKRQSGFCAFWVCPYPLSIWQLFIWIILLFKSP